MDLLKRFIRYYRPHRGLFILDMTAAVLSSGLAVLFPAVVFGLYLKRVHPLPAPDWDWAACADYSNAQFRPAVISN